MTLTLIISAPAELLFLNWLHTIWKGSMRLPTPDAVHAGGGVRVRPRRPDRPVPGDHLHRPLPARHHVRGGPLPPDHGGGHVPGHLRRHLLLVPQDVRAAARRAAGQVALLALASSSSPWCSAGSCWPATPGSRGGLGSLPVRVPEAPGARLNRWTSYFAFALGASQLLFVWNFFANVFRKAERRGQPLAGGHAGVDRRPPRLRPTTSTPSPPWCAARTSCPTPRWRSALGRDWIAQNEVLP